MLTVPSLHPCDCLSFHSSRMLRSKQHKLFIKFGDEEFQLVTELSVQVGERGQPLLLQAVADRLQRAVQARKRNSALVAGQPLVSESRSTSSNAPSRRTSLKSMSSFRKS